MSPDLAGYLLPVHADVPQIEATFIEVADPYVNSLGAKGAGEIGVTGMAAAIATALQPPAGPVFLSLPLDDWNKPADGPAGVRTVSTRVAPDPERLNEFAEAIRHASRPVLIYGGAIARGSGWHEAVALADTLSAPVWVAPAPERAPFPEDHPLYRGILPFAKGPLSESLEGHDLALVVGAPVFRYYPYVPGPYLPGGMRLLHISDDPSETSRAPVGDSLLADAVLSLVALKDLLAERVSSNTKTRIHARPRIHRVAGPAANGSHGDRPSAAQVFAALSEIRPAHAVLVEETPSNIAALKKAWPITEPDTFYTFASGALGRGLPASVGIALAERNSGRNRPVISIIGDGSSQYAIQAMWNAAQLRLPLLIVIMRNEEYAILKSFARLEQTPDVPSLDLPGMDFVSTAKGYGCDAVRVKGLGGDQGGSRESVGKGRADGAGNPHLAGNPTTDLAHRHLLTSTRFGQQVFCLVSICLDLYGGSRSTKVRT
jgi:benzoylformate decarboxylase